MALVKGSDEKIKTGVKGGKLNKTIVYKKNRDDLERKI